MEFFFIFVLKSLEFSFYTGFGLKKIVSEKDFYGNINDKKRQRNYV